jgi:hypothetical protein
MGPLIHRLRLDTPGVIDQWSGAEAAFLASRRAADALADLDEKEPFRNTVLQGARRRFREKLEQAEFTLAQTWAALRASPKLARRSLWSQAVALEQNGYHHLFEIGVISEEAFEKLQLLVDLKQEAVRLEHLPPPVAAHEPLTTGWKAKMRSNFPARQPGTEELFQDVIEEELSDMVLNQRRRQELKIGYEYEFAMFEVAAGVAEQIAQLAEQHALDEVVAAGCVGAYQALREQSLRRLMSAAADEPALVEQLQGLILRRHALSAANNMLDEFVARGLISEDVAAQTRSSLE